MKLCPKCGVTAGDDVAFCEADGVRLLPARTGTLPERHLTATLELTESPFAASAKESVAPESDKTVFRIGARTAAGEVVDALGRDQFVVRSPDGFAVAVFGDAFMIARESAALSAVVPTPMFPRVLGEGHDEGLGPFLLLARPDASMRAWAEVSKELDVGAMSAVMDEVLEAADALLKAGFSWSPEIEDVWVDAHGHITLSRVRVARQEDHFDPRALVKGLAMPFLAEHGPRPGSRVLHLLLASPRASSSIQGLRSDFARAAADARSRGRLADDFAVAALESDVGLRHAHNEDAGAVCLGETNGEPWTVMVVCDGVSSSARADQASAIAAKTTREALEHFAKSGDVAFESASRAMDKAIRAAHLALCASFMGQSEDDPPGTTIVAALIVRKWLTVGWVGDSRAYFLSPKRSELLTEDHSWLNETVRSGAMTEEEAQRSPLAHALTRCLGPLETGSDKPREIEVSVLARELGPKGHVMLCSDGLWNYFPSPYELMSLVQSAGVSATPRAIARHLVGHALVGGGHDNITVAIYAHDAAKAKK